MTPKFFRTIFDETSLYRCISLIERHAPRLMKSGGGRLQKEVRRSGVTDSPQVRAHLLALFNRGCKWREMAVELGCSLSLVQTLLKRMGLRRRVQKQKIAA